MSLKKCSANGQSGWQWGSQGKCYTGPDGKKKAIQEGVAEEGEEGLKKKMAKATGALTRAYTDAEYESAVADLLVNGLPEDELDDRFVGAVHAYVSKKERDKMSDADFGWPEEKKYPVKDQKHLEAAFRLLGRAPKEKQAAIRKRLVEITKRKGLKVPNSEKQGA